MATTSPNEMTRDKLAPDSPIREQLKRNPFYIDWKQEGKEIGIVEGTLKNALTLMKTMNLDADQAADALELDDVTRQEFFRRLNSKYKPQ
jgi:hypothetical protein